MSLNHLLTNIRVYFSTYVSEHSLQNTKINKLNRKVALNEKVKYTRSNSRERHGENPL